jgi:hypothetical protein
MTGSVRYLCSSNWSGGTVIVFVEVAVQVLVVIVVTVVVLVVEEEVTVVVLIGSVRYVCNWSDGICSSGSSMRSSGGTSKWRPSKYLRS